MSGIQLSGCFRSFFDIDVYLPASAAEGHLSRAAGTASSSQPCSGERWARALLHSPALSWPLLCCPSAPSRSELLGLKHSSLSCFIKINGVAEAGILPRPPLSLPNREGSPRTGAGGCSYSPYQFHGAVGAGRSNPRREESSDRSTSRCGTLGLTRFFYQAPERELLTLIVVSSVPELLRAAATCLLLQLWGEASSTTLQLEGQTTQDSYYLLSLYLSTR